jgi:hypothetical protein
MEERERRLAQNEILFREVNERVDAVASAHGDDDHVYEFYCECSNADCTMQLPLPLKAYEAVRAHPSRFIVAPGHALPEIESVVEQADDWWVVEKSGEAAVLAAGLDPRSR